MTMVAVIVEVEMGVGSYCVSSIIVVSRIGLDRCAGHPRCAGQKLDLHSPTS